MSDWITAHEEREAQEARDWDGVLPSVKTRWVITDYHLRREESTEASEPQAAFREVFGVMPSEVRDAAELDYSVPADCRSCEVGADEVSLEFQPDPPAANWRLDFARAS